VTLWATSDLHVSHPDIRAVVDSFLPSGDDDWLIVAGDVAEHFDDVVSVLATLARRFARVIWTPGNHDLWTLAGDPHQLRGEARYWALVDELRNAGVTTPEDPYLTWTGPGGPVTVVPVFVLYDYSFLPPGATTVEKALELAGSRGVTCTDEFVLHPDPHPDRAAWCRHRLSSTRARLDALPVEHRTLLVGHWPLVREPTDILFHPEFAPWCGTTATADWPRRYNAAAVVYGHLHIPRTMVVDGVPHLEVSLGYPREWRARRVTSVGLRRVFPAGREAELR
jgi:3',5'-cyclic AMP phosphodiesterase CpdA